MVFFILSKQHRPEGKRYEGEWKNGKQSGKGTYRNAKGETIVGEWIDGKRVGAKDSGSKIKQKGTGTKPTTNIET